MSAEWKATVPGPQGIIDWTYENPSTPRIAQKAARLYYDWIGSWLPRVEKWARFRDVGLEDLEAVRDEFHTYAFCSRKDDQVEHLDAVLAGLYDWADTQRVWVDPINAWVIPEVAV